MKLPFPSFFRRSGGASATQPEKPPHEKSLHELRQELPQRSAKSFEHVLEQEWREIRAARGRRIGKEDYPDAETPGGRLTARRLVGLAFSGGGIRSATLNLGILQGLAEFGLLEKAHYVSAVSGGNYISSWLAGWIKREGFSAVNTALPPDHAPTGRRSEPRAIRWLRDYSNYLTPRLGALSGDTWTAISTYLRNVLLNQTILILTFAGLLLIPRVLTVWSAGWGTGGTGDLVLGPARLPQGVYVSQISERFGSGYLFFFTGMVLLVLGVWRIQANMGWFARSPGEDRTPLQQPGAAQKETKKQEGTASGPKGVLLTIVLPFVLGAWSLTVWMWFGPASWNAPRFFWLRDGALRYALIVAVAYATPWIIGSFLGTFAPRILGLPTKGVLQASIAIPLAALLSGAMGGLLLRLVGELFHSWNPRHHSDFNAGLWYGMTWGPPMMLVIMSLMAVLHIGLMGVAFQDGKREWWSRLGGMLLTAVLLWTALFVTGIYGPLLLMWMGAKASATGFLGWVATTVGGVLGGKNPQTNGKKPSWAVRAFLRVAPFVFIAGLMLLVSMGLHLVVVQVALPDTRLSVISRFFQTPEEPPAACVTCPAPGLPVSIPYDPTRFGKAAAVHWSLMTRSAGPENLWEMLLVLGCAALLAWRVDINEFAMHLFYRNRLGRCYLGASREKRDANPFTGFSAQDDLYLASLSNSPDVKDELGAEASGRPGYEGPYPLVNAALNETAGEQLAWQSRKARSFFFSPLYSGFEVLPEEKHHERLQDEGYRETSAFAYSHSFGLGGPLLSTAMGISGAAASPNMGYHSSASLAFLMTVFNVRLGWWMGNPRRYKAWMRQGPPFGLVYLLHELAGTATSKRGYVYLSDGGHFENLGIYELVRRRCAYIIAVDASADPEVNFEDLGNAIEKCRVDLGVDITLDVSKLKPPAGSRNCREHSAVGTIHYNKADSREEDGHLIYFKSSLTGDEPVDVRHYSEKDKAFPHTATADQFFDEAQFESYRELGYHILRSTMSAGASAPADTPFAILDSIRKSGGTLPGGGATL